MYIAIQVWYNLCIIPKESGGKDTVHDMTDKQLKTILDGCKDIEEARKKVQKLLESQNGK